MRKDPFFLSIQKLGMLGILSLAPLQAFASGDTALNCVEALYQEICSTEPGQPSTSLTENGAPLIEWLRELYDEDRKAGNIGIVSFDLKIPEKDGLQLCSPERSALIEAMAQRGCPAIEKRIRDEDTLGGANLAGEYAANVAQVLPLESAMPPEVRAYFSEIDPKTFSSASLVVVYDMAKAPQAQPGFLASFTAVSPDDSSSTSEQQETVLYPVQARATLAQGCFGARDSGPSLDLQIRTFAKASPTRKLWNRLFHSNRTIFVAKTDFDKNTPIFQALLTHEIRHLIDYDAFPSHAHYLARMNDQLTMPRYFKKLLDEKRADPEALEEIRETAKYYTNTIEYRAFTETVRFLKVRFGYSKKRIRDILFIEPTLRQNELTTKEKAELLNSSLGKSLDAYTTELYYLPSLPLFQERGPSP